MTNPDKRHVDAVRDFTFPRCHSLIAAKRELYATGFRMGQLWCDLPAAVGDQPGRGIVNVFEPGGNFAALVTNFYATAFNQHDYVPLANINGEYFVLTEDRGGEPTNPTLYDSPPFAFNLPNPFTVFKN